MMVKHVGLERPTGNTRKLGLTKPDDAPLASDWGKFKLAQAEAKLLQAEAKIEVRKANVEAAKRLLQAATDEAQRLGVYYEVAS